MTVTTKEKAYRSIDVCRLAGITYRQLDYWCRTGLITPSVHDADGSGTKRRYSKGDVVLALAIRHLLDAGLSVQAVRPIIGRFHDEIVAGEPDFLIVAGPRSSHLVTTAELPALIRELTGPVWMLPLDTVHAELEDRAPLLTERWLPTYFQGL